MAGKEDVDGKLEMPRPSTTRKLLIVRTVPEFDLAVPSVELTHVCCTDLVGGKWMLENFFEAMDEPNEW